MISTSTTLLSFYFQQNLRGFLKNFYRLFNGHLLIVSFLKYKIMFLIYGAKLVCDKYHIISIRLSPQMILRLVKDSKRKKESAGCLLIATSGSLVN